MSAAKPLYEIVQEPTWKAFKEQVEDKETRNWKVKWETFRFNVVFAPIPEGTPMPHSTGIRMQFYTVILEMES